MPDISLFNLAVSAVAFLGSYVLNRFYGDLQRTTTEMQALSLHVAESCVLKGDYREDMLEIKTDLRTILTELRNKKDRDE